MKINWTEPAVKDVEEIVKFIIKDEEYRSFGEHVGSSIYGLVGTLADMPMSGRKGDISKTRELVFKHWNMIYNVEKDNVNVLAVVDKRKEHPVSRYREKTILELLQ